MTQYLIILFSFVVSIGIAQPQINKRVTFETESNSLKKLFSEKKYLEALTAVNRLIGTNPSDGINYFSRAVIKFHVSKSGPETDTSIINDCVTAIKLSYKNPEVHYLLFITYFKYCVISGLVGYGAGNALFEEIIDLEKTKEQIDAALVDFPYNEKYLDARIKLLQMLFKYTSMNETDLKTFYEDCKNILGVKGMIRTKLMPITN